MPTSPLPDSAVPVESPDAAEATEPRHRRVPRLHRPATLVTTFITVGAVALAGYATMAPGQTMTADNVRTSLSQAAPVVGADVVGELRQGLDRQQAAAGSVRIDRLAQAHQAVVDTAEVNSRAQDAARERSEELVAEREAEEAAAEQAAAEQAAAEQAAAERAEEQAASREQEREAAPVEEPVEAEPAPEPAPEPEPEPAPEPAPPSGNPRSIAQSMLGSYGWGQDQWGCLESLWTRESGWNTYAQNPSSGAYGIPQALPGSKMASAGSDWQTNPATQISWGLGYISGRYGTPCSAWAHSESVGWY